MTKLDNYLAISGAALHFVQASGTQGQGSLQHSIVPSVRTPPSPEVNCAQTIKLRTFKLMPRGYPPSIFVSSTCYDLSQVRLDLKDFIEGLGYDAVISESTGFPVNPQATALDNCIRAVRDRADILVLIVGTRYGNTVPDQENRSITNLEYREAQAKGIPIYVFISKQVVTVLPIWKENPQADYKKFVDTSKLFEFAEYLRGESGAWAFTFDEAADIINTLRQQWALLFTDALESRGRLIGPALSPDLLRLAPEPLAILLNKPRAWEHRLLASVIRSELQKFEPLRLDLKYQLDTGLPEHLSDVRQVMDWISHQMNRALRLVQSGAQIMNKAVPDAMGPPGKPGDPSLLAYVGRRYADVVEGLLKWRRDQLEVHVPNECSRLMQIVSSVVIPAIEKLEFFPQLLDTEISKSLEAESRGESYVADARLVLEAPVPKEYYEEMDRIAELY